METATSMTLEQIVDDYVNKARAKTRLTEYKREERDGYTLHRISENDQFRILDHRIAVRGRRVMWVWRNQDFWPTDELTDVAIADDDLCSIGVIHGGNRISGVKFTIGPRHGAGVDPDNCLPFVSDYLHLEAHYRIEDGAMKLNRARIGVDFLSKNGCTVKARFLRQSAVAYRNHGYLYRASLGARLLVNISGKEKIGLDLPVQLSDSQVKKIHRTVMSYDSDAPSDWREDIFTVRREQ